MRNRLNKRDQNASEHNLIPDGVSITFIINMLIVIYHCIINVEEEFVTERATLCQRTGAQH